MLGLKGSVNQQRYLLATRLPGNALTGNWIEWEDIPNYFSSGKGSVVVVTPNYKVRERYFRELIQEHLEGCDIHYTQCYIRSKFTKADVRFVSLDSFFRERIAGCKFDKYYWVA